MEAECVNSTSFLENKTEDEQIRIRDELIDIKTLMEQLVGNALHNTKPNSLCI